MWKFDKKINKDLWPIKAHYFLFNAGTSPVTPYLSVYVRQLGFSSNIVGLIYTILPICGMIGKPLFGILADKFKIQKHILLVSLLLTCLAIIGIIFSPRVAISRNVIFSCNKAGSHFDTIVSNLCLLENLKEDVACKFKCPLDQDAMKMMCNNYWSNDFCNITDERAEFTAIISAEKSNTKGNVTYFYLRSLLSQNTLFPIVCESGKEISTYCSVLCNSTIINDVITQPVVHDKDAVYLYQFWVILVLMMIYWVTLAVINTLADTICFMLLDDKPHKYGYQRLFGALGWGVVSIISGFMLDLMSEGKIEKYYSPVFFMGVVFLVINFLISLKFFKFNKNARQKFNVNILKNSLILIYNIKFILFAIVCLIVGMASALIWNFFFWMVEDLARENGCSSEKRIKTMEGLALAIHTLGGELPFFFLSEWILLKMGHVHALSMVLFVFGIRFLLYSIISNPWYFLPIEFSNGFTFAIFYACMTSYTSILAPEGTEATAQGLVGAVFEGVGVSLGSLTAGNLYSIYGGPLTFRIFGIGALITCIIHAGCQALIKDSTAEYRNPQQALADIGNAGNENNSS